MNVKKVIYNNKEQIIVTNEKEENFKIYYGGSDLYWGLENYTKDNVFIIKEEDILFKYLKQLFLRIKDNNLFPDSYTFIWYSEAYGEIEDANKLIIKEYQNQYTIQFIQNPKHYLSKMRNTCYISFCLSGSRNQQVADLFSIMFQKLCDEIEISHEKVKQKI